MAKHPYRKIDHGRCKSTGASNACIQQGLQKLHNNHKLEVDRAIELIKLNPEAGEAKRGDLLGVYVYKFKSNQQLMLLAYEFDPKTRMLLLLGTHENYYRELKSLN